MCQDIVKGKQGTRTGVGGTVYYFSGAFSALGGRSIAITKTNDDEMLRQLKSIGAETQYVGPGSNCRFELAYRGPERSIRLLKRSSKITRKDLDLAPTDSCGIHLGPVEHELDSDIRSDLQDFSLRSLDVQGLIRRIDGKTAKIRHSTGLSTELRKWMNSVDIVKMGREEARSILGSKKRWQKATSAIREKGKPREFIITLGPKGALLYSGPKMISIPPYPSDPVDWTGAGDCFMAGFMHRRLSGMDSIKACHFGSALAACVIERSRPLRFPDFVEVSKKVSEGPVL